MEQKLLSFMFILLAIKKTLEPWKIGGRSRYSHAANLGITCESHYLPYHLPKIETLLSFLPPNRVEWRCVIPASVIFPRDGTIGTAVVRGSSRQEGDQSTSIAQSTFNYNPHIGEIYICQLRLRAFQFRQYLRPLTLHNGSKNWSPFLELGVVGI